MKYIALRHGIWARGSLAISFFILIGNFFSPPDVLADQYEVAMSQNEAVCKTSSRFFTDYIELLHKRFPNVTSIVWQPNIADILIRERHAEFSIIDWTEVQRLVPDLQMKKGEITQASVDIDNDGQLDLVVRIQWHLRGLPTDMLAIFQGKGNPLARSETFLLTCSIKQRACLISRSKVVALRKPEEMLSAITEGVVP